MTKPLRKMHFRLWAILAVVLPAAIITAWVSIPAKKTQALLQTSSNTILPVILEKSENEKYFVALRGSFDTSQLQLQWISKKKLQYPTALIYAVAENGDGINGSKLIGRIEATGEWYFRLDSTFTHEPDHVNRFVLYDFIHQQIIDTINLKR